MTAVEMMPSPASVNGTSANDDFTEFGYEDVKIIPTTVYDDTRDPNVADDSKQVDDLD